MKNIPVYAIESRFLDDHPEHQDISLPFLNFEHRPVHV